MAEPVSKQGTTANLRLISSTVPRSGSAALGARMFLQLARDLSTAATREEVWMIAQEFLRRAIGPCTVEVVEINTRGGIKLREQYEEPESATVAQIATVDGLCRVVVPLVYRGSVMAWYVIDFRDGADLGEDDLNLIDLVSFTCAGDLARIANSRHQNDHVDDLNFMRRLEHEISMAPDIQSIGDMLKVELSTVISCTFIALLTVSVTIRRCSRSWHIAASMKRIVSATVFQ
ncbi:MAG: hypothetical protein R3A46_19900 [Thermomicrobiales bacterium]